MRWSIRLGQVAGIGIFVHWTFFLLLAWVGYAHLASGDSAAAALRGVGFIISLFACVVLHELGHALTARRYGVATRDITLLPIGGVARLERIPEKPMQEFFVAIAGPAVNVVIAAVLFGIIHTLGLPIATQASRVSGSAFAANLMWVNVALVVFNMLPAFPMDGGRVLRALLATRMTRVRATHVAASVGQVMAMLFGFVGILSGNWMLLFIAMFVYVGAQGEAQAVEMRSVFRSHRVSDAMIRRFQTLSEEDTVEEAARESATSQQRDFPVMNGETVAGLVFYDDVLKALRSGQNDQPVGQIMRRDCLVASADDPLDRALDRMNACGCRTLLVQHGGRLAGMLSEEHLGRWMLLHSSVSRRDSDDSGAAA
ncbi:MAG: site-2 protease family protein [Planctomycetaceae bacterium]